MKEDVPIFLQHSLVDLRTRMGLSQEEAAHKLGISRTTLRNWEKDSAKVSYENILKIEEIYKIPQDYIFFGTGNTLRVKLNEVRPKNIK